LLLSLLVWWAQRAPVSVSRATVSGKVSGGVTPARASAHE
jgi:hypothetical protein